MDSGVRAALGSGWLGLRLVLWADRVESSPLSCPAHLPAALLLHPGRKSLVLALFCCRQKSQHSESLLFTLEVQFSHSIVSDSATPWTAARQASLSITTSQSLLKLMSIKLVMPSSHFILCHPLLLLPPIPPSIRVFSNESTICMRWPKYWSFSFSIIPSKEHPGLISLRMDWLDLLAVQGTLKSLL